MEVHHYTKGHSSQQILSERVYFKNNRLDQYCENIVMSSLVLFQSNRGATIRNHVLVCPVNRFLQRGQSGSVCFPHRNKFAAVGNCKNCCTIAFLVK